MIKDILLILALIIIAGAGYVIYALSTIVYAIGLMIFGPSKDKEND